MDIRNARFNHAGTIDCEIDHPIHGWIPFTADPQDAEPLGLEVFDAVKDSAAPYVPAPPDPEALKEAYRQAVQAHIDATAAQRGYEAGHTLAGYTASAVPLWQAEAQAFVVWRDQVWLSVFDTLAQIEAGEAEPPKSADALIGTLPKIEWPKD